MVRFGRYDFMSDMACVLEGLYEFAMARLQSLTGSEEGQTSSAERRRTFSTIHLSLLYSVVDGFFTQ